MKLREVAAVVLGIGIALFLILAVLPTLRAKNVNIEQVAVKVAQEIVAAKPGAILVSTDGELLHLMSVSGGLHGLASYNMYGGINNSREPAAMGKIVARVVNQEEPGYNDLARRYLRGDHVEPSPAPSQ